MRASRVVASALLWLTLSTTVVAHPTPFSNINLNVTDDGVDVVVIAYAFDFAEELTLGDEARAIDRAVVGNRFERLAALVTSRLRIELGGQPLTATPIDVAVSPDRKAVTFRLHYAGAAGPRIRVTAQFFPYDPLHESFVSVRRRGQLVGEAILTADRPTTELSMSGGQSRLEVVRRFTRSGIEHIAIGPDHVLFLIGLLLLGGSFWQLVRIVTAFTLAHSVTLSLAALDIVSPPARLIEPAIALSICVVGANNLFRGLHPTEAGSGRSRDLRGWFAFGFGLIHGFGFANVLRALDLPRAALGWSLFAFNLGVEIGQLVIVIGVTLLLVWVARRSEILHRRIVLVGSLAVLWAGGFWFVQRVFFA